MLVKASANLNPSLAASLLSLTSLYLMCDKVYPVTFALVMLTAMLARWNMTKSDSKGLISKVFLWRWEDSSVVQAIITALSA